MANKQALGRGFDALIPKNLDKTILEEDKNRVQKVLIDDIVPNPDQPRGQLDQATLDEMTASVKRHGVLQPIIVVRHQDAKQPQKAYRIVAGERRWRAAKAANLKHIPAIVRSLQELEQIEIALIENIQRVDLSPLEQALSVFKLQQQFNMTLEEIAQKLGKATSTLSNLTRLLGLPELARQALADGRISEGHARAILALKGQSAKQGELLHCILNNNWSVRQAEHFVKKTKKAKNDGLSSSKVLTYNNDVKISKQLTTEIGTDVKIKRLARGGQIIIPFASEQQLKEISQKIANQQPEDKT